MLIGGSVWGCGVYSFPTVPRFSLVGCKNSTYKMSCPHGIDKRLGLTVYKMDTKCSEKELFESVAAPYSMLHISELGAISTEVDALYSDLCPTGQSTQVSREDR